MSQAFQWGKVRPFTLVSVTLAFLLLLSACAPAAPSGPAAAPAAPKPAPAQPAAAPPAQPATLTVTSVQPATNAPSIGIKWLGDTIAERTSGRISFQYKWGGSLAKPGEEVDAVKSGLADIGLIITPYYPTRLPLANLTFAVPLGPSDAKMVVEIARELYNRFPAMRKELEDNNQVPLTYMPLLSFEMASRAPINKPEDLKGKRVGQAGGKYAPQAYQVLGASNVSLPGPEHYQALQTGVIDANVLAWEYIETFKIHEVAKYMVRTDYGGNFAYVLTINKDTWNKLSPADQKLMQDLALEVERRVVDESVRKEKQALDTLTKAGVTFIEFSPADKEKWAQSIPNLPQQWAEEMEGRGLPGKQIMKTFIQLAKDKGYKWPREWAIQ
ncbi:MAG: C4-dicarboxylate TRAP transporter substrate-binding protein [Chloroflexi bacterium]|nr:C4-dicarboxylate TRAP transporter substrate-binding protein [Chloroflexota bacterium]